MDTVSTEIDNSEEEFNNITFPELTAKTMDNTGAMLLANAIVTRAADDYRSEIRAAHSMGLERESKSATEKFFSSKWFEMLTSLDGKALITSIKRDELNNCAHKEKASNGR